MPTARPSDADLMRGGPGVAEGAPAPQHGDPAPYDGTDADQRRPGAAAPAGQTVKVRFDGVEYEVPAGLADAWRKERDRIAGTAGARIQQLEQRLAALEQDDEPEPDPAAVSGAPQPPDPRNLDPASDQYDPGKYHRDNLAWQQYLVSASIEQVETRRREEAALEAARARQNVEWNRNVSQFYRDNPELRGNEDIVDAVWRSHFNDLKDLPLKDGFAELAKLSKQRLVQLTESGRRVSARRAPTLETSTGARANRAREPEETPNEPVRGGLSAAIKRKNQRFRNPNFGQRREAATA